MCLKFKIWEQIDWNLVFGRSGLNSRVFEKLFISYSYILFIKHCALRSFCIKMLCFLKFWFFQIKNLVWICLAQSLLDWCWIDRICFSIDRTYFSTNRKSVREFFKTWDFHVFFTISKFFKKLFPLSSTNPNSLSIFCCFPTNFSQGFCRLAPVRPFYPFFFWFNFIFLAFFHAF